MKTVTRWDFIKMVSKKVEGKCPQRYIYYIVQAVFDCFEDILKDGNRFVVGNIFSLEPRYKKERKIGNFGNPMTIPGHWEPRFKAYCRLKRACEELDKETVEKDVDYTECEEDE